MKIDVYFTPLGLNAGDLSGRGVVVVDVLRATTSIVTALANGAKAVVPAATSEEAVRLTANLEKNGYVAGRLVKAVRKGRRKIALNDAATVVLDLPSRFPNWAAALGASEAARELRAADLGEDVAFSAKADRFSVVPSIVDRRIVA